MKILSLVAGYLLDVVCRSLCRRHGHRWVEITPPGGQRRYCCSRCLHNVR